MSSFSFPRFCQRTKSCPLHAYPEDGATTIPHPRTLPRPRTGPLRLERTDRAPAPCGDPFKSECVLALLPHQERLYTLRVCGSFEIQDTVAMVMSPEEGDLRRVE